MGQFVEKLQSSLHKGFIDRHATGADDYKPQLLVNRQRPRETVLSTLLEELERCEQFLFSVAFITESGLATLKAQLYDLAQKGIKGRILTSTFLNFNQPKVFRELLKLSNVEVRLTALQGFHAKGYIFQHDTHTSLIVGSSNLTAHALKVNYEWNVKLTSHDNGDVVHHFNEQFEQVWQSATVLTPQWIAAYAEQYEQGKAQMVAEVPAPYQINPLEIALAIEPNNMQQTALKQIAALRADGATKGLVISATGTGKTYLSAFDVRQARPKRMLFIVHREQILQKARADYQKVLAEPPERFGLLTGSRKDVDCPYVFATIQTLAKDETLQQFARDHFDYVLIDEVHKAGAQSYRKVIDYFTPQFMLGMTATPERTDEFNIFELFDYNIAYEIRLQEALEEDMLCPFHYYGVTDFVRDGELIDETALLQQLVTDERIEHVVEKLRFYGHSGETCRGLLFCSRKDEARELSRALNSRGFVTEALTGEDSQQRREQVVEQLEAGQLDYIITVDIFNEGIDIPSVNQVVMLRQTESSIIFIQQLGRGLRKHPSKEFVTIIDFIGNYRNNYLIPIALSGDRSQSKDNVRRHMKDTSYLSGVSTINFEAIAKKQIFAAINNSNLTALKLLKEEYTQLKNRLGRVPYLYDFVTHHSLDPLVLMTKARHYHEFLVKMKEEVAPLTTVEDEFLTFISSELLNGKRPHELVLLEQLLQGDVTEQQYRERLVERSAPYNERLRHTLIRILSLQFFSQTDRKKYGEQPLVQFIDGQIVLAERLRQRLNANADFRSFVTDTLRTAMAKNRLYEAGKSLTLYEKYTRKDVCRLLMWDNDESSTIYGYKPKHDVCPIFVTYDKHEDVSESIAYKDELLSPDVFRWFTRSKRTLQSEEVRKIVEAEQTGLVIHVFIKKSDDEGTTFYYLGEALPDVATVKEERMPNGDPVVTMNLKLQQPVTHELYMYLIDNE